MHAIDIVNKHWLFNSRISGTCKTVEQIQIRVCGLKSNQTKEANWIFKCPQVEIAGKLTFGPKTFIKAYVEYYRSGIDFLQTDGVSPQELQQYYNGNFFLRDRSYGTMEVIILEMRYAKKKQIETLRRNQGYFQRLSSFIEHAVRDVGKPSSIKVYKE